MRFYVKHLILVFLVISSCKTAVKKAPEEKNISEPHRPAIHFTPKANWMNDPNGMVFYKNQYHLFYQYYPDSTVWGPMHWAHASTTDLVNWEHHPIALYPDSLGYIFSGSAVADVDNTSGFGKEGKPPLVAIFTHHDPKGEQQGKSNYENQSIAYSLDGGMNWTKYAGNPVLKNPGIKDFRDPKVSWHEASKKWIMTLATRDRISFYSSPNLKTWTKESEFGSETGAHTGVWECPDLFPLQQNGKITWILLVSVGSGGPNGGSATQYFTGRFDGHQFIPYDTTTRWIDHGPDNYAGVTWSNTGDRKIFLGWMSNWQYANKVPTKKWRGAMTIPRELSLVEMDSQSFLISNPVLELDALNANTVTLEDVYVWGEYQLSEKIKNASSVSRLDLKIAQAADFTIVLSNEKGNRLELGYDRRSNRYYIDRKRSGEAGFEPGFARRHFAPRIYTGKNMTMTLIIDLASVEMFADNGLTVMTAIFFPNEPMTNYTIRSAHGIDLQELKYAGLKAAEIK